MSSVRSRSVRSSTLLAALVASASLGPGCGAAGGPGSASALTMEPVRVTATRTDEGRLALDAYDARELLARGNEDLAAGRHDLALASYDRLVAEFGDSALAGAAHYNAALALERAGRLGDAADRYLRLAELFPEGEDAAEALFQAAGCRERLEDWAAAASLLGRVLGREDLEPRERLEAMARRGAALVLGGELDAGERLLRQAVAYARRAGDEAVPTDFYLAQAQHFLGEVARIRMGRVPLSADERQFRSALEARCDLLLRAQVQYVQAIRIGNAHWAAASAYRIGDVYSTLFQEVLAVPVPEAEIPEELTDPEEIDAFRQEFPRHYRRLLQQYLEPLLQNAIRWWETNLMMVERTGVEGEWVLRTREELVRIRELLDEIAREADAADAEDAAPAAPAASPAAGPPPR